MNKHYIRIFLISYSIAVAFLFLSCDRNLTIALEVAGNNRDELEKVISHFKEDPNPLKYKAAKFLIENMLPRYCFRENLWISMKRLIFGCLPIPCNFATVSLSPLPTP